MSIRTAVKRLEMALAPPFQGEPDIVLINIGYDSGIPEAEKTGRGVALYHNGQLVEDEGAQAGSPAIIVFIGADATEESVLQAIEEAKTNDQLYKNGFVSVTVGMDDD